MKILLTNDDGLHAPGISVFNVAIAEMGEVWVVAPHQERSGASHSLTMNEPIRVQAHGERRFSATGPPVDCVYLGIHNLLGSTPDLVLSGINKGANLGDDVLYSGTVGAAREAALNDIPALAVSLASETGPEDFHFDTAAALAVDVISQMVNRSLPPGIFLNLNVPNRPLDTVAGIKVCGLGRRHYNPLVERRHDPRNKPYYWIGGEPVGEGMQEGSDGWWIRKGFATLTPLGLDTTQADWVPRINDWTLSKREES